MDQRQLASVLFAVVGVLIAASRLPDIVYYAAALAQWNRGDDPDGQRLAGILVIGSSLLAVLVGVGLIFLRNRLANRLFPPAGQPLNAPEAHAVALSVLGCYFVVEGLSGIARGGRPGWGSATQLVVCVGLFLGARGVSRLWSLGRTDGLGRVR